MLKQHFADVDDSEIKSERQMQLKTQYLQGFKDGFESQREFCMDVLDKIKVEIEQEITYKPKEMWDYRMGLTKALEIIDKHR